MTAWYTLLLPHLDGVGESMAQVQRARHIRRRDHDHVWGLLAIHAWLEVALLHPPVVPASAPSQAAQYILPRRKVDLFKSTKDPRLAVQSTAASITVPESGASVPGCFYCLGRIGFEHLLLHILLLS